VGAAALITVGVSGAGVSGVGVSGADHAGERLLQGYHSAREFGHGRRHLRDVKRGRVGVEGGGRHWCEPARRLRRLIIGGVGHDGALHAARLTLGPWPRTMLALLIARALLVAGTAPIGRRLVGVIAALICRGRLVSCSGHKAPSA
jgi:hypothetical protein